MLTLYAFLIFALGSSVIAMPTGALQDYGVAVELEANKDQRLLTGKWSRLLERTVEPGQSVKKLTWSDAQNCDDIIDFRPLFKLTDKSFFGVHKVRVHRVVRQLEKPGNKYIVKQNSGGQSQIEEVYHEVSVFEYEKIATFLDKTFWELDGVSDGVLIWKSQ